MVWASVQKFQLVLLPDGAGERTPLRKATRRMVATTFSSSLVLGAHVEKPRINAHACMGRRDPVLSAGWVAARLLVIARDLLCVRLPPAPRPTPTRESPPPASCPPLL